MVLFIPENIVLTACERGNDTQVDTKTGAVDHRILLTLIVGKLTLQLLVKVQRTIEEGRTSATSTIFLSGLDGSLLDALIIDQTGVAVRSEHEHLFAIHDDFGVLFT